MKEAANIFLQRNQHPVCPAPAVRELLLILRFDLNMPLVNLAWGASRSIEPCHVDPINLESNHLPDIISTFAPRTGPRLSSSKARLASSSG